MKPLFRSTFTCGLLLLAGMPGLAANYTTNARQGSGYWDTSPGIWSGGLTASGAFAADPSATFEVIIPGARLRTTDPSLNTDPYTLTPLTFPGTSANTLTIDGDGVYRNGAASTDPIAEIRFKCPAVLFPKVIMNGGIWDQGDTTSTNGVVSVHGEVNVNGVNFPIYNDGGADRGFTLDYLTGSGSIEYRAYTDVTTFKPGDKNGFVLIGTSNTYSGTWNVVIGVLLGAGQASLGTNTITIGPAGAMETLYDVNNTNANLILNGRLFLHQNDMFYNVVLGGTNVLAPGTYQATDLSAAYPAFFPATWTQHLPSTVTTSSGQLTVLTNNIVVPIQHPIPLLLGTGLVGENANFSAAFVGQAPITYRWQKGTNSIGTFTNLNDGGRISGTATTSLTISNVVLPDAGFYRCAAFNPVGSASTFAAQLIVLSEGGISNFTASLNEPLGSDWETPNFWNNPTGATYLATVYPGSTFEILPGGNVRTPNAALNSTFPVYAASLQIDGDGVFGNGGTPTIGQLMFKAQSAGHVTIPHVVMNGGQINNGQDGSYVSVSGQIDILTNTPIYEDNGSGSGDRGYRFDSFVTGSGTIEVHLHPAGPTYVQALNFTCPTNTFSGQWNIVSGTVLGSGANSLGTNTITIGDGAALETSYDIYNPLGSLIIPNAGQVFLHQNDTFLSVSIGGVNLVPGIHSFDDLTAAYPANFPATWTQQVGSPTNAASGSLTVLGAFLSIQQLGANLQVSWAPTNLTLLEAATLSGPWATNSASSPYVFSPTNAMKFYRVQVQ